MTAAIVVENLAKSYRVNHEKLRGYRTLRESLSSIATAPIRRFRNGGNANGSEDFWALNDVSFEVQPGEVVGIIGRNGAGKSTLLKILSRITKPTRGRVTLNGRVGSLLEVGTGFHPELTGRENIYMNGSILGMSRREISAKFEEIVAFAEVEKFLDTPVKRYSSGMYVRLAFAVAAHLEPEILIVDEVLSVGDASFQRRCYQKMNAIRNSGRTVLVVSHNLGAITNICSQAINLENGQVVSQGEAQQQVNWYLARLVMHSRQAILDRSDRDGDQQALVVGIELRDIRDQPIEQAVSGSAIRIVVRCTAESHDTPIDAVALSLWTADGTKVFHVDNSMRITDLDCTGRNREFICTFPQLAVPAGLYLWNVMLSGAGRVRDHLYAAATMEVLPGDFFGTGCTTDAEGGMMLINHDWQASTVGSAMPV